MNGPNQRRLRGGSGGAHGCHSPDEVPPGHATLSNLEASAGRPAACNRPPDCGKIGDVAKPTTMSFGAVGLLILLAGGMPAQELPQATMEHGAFAFPDPGGSRLLTLANPSQPALLHTALCNGGGRFSVRFERRQAEIKGHNGRHTPNNFDKLEGDVFTVLQGKIEESANCFLASDSLLSSATVLPAEPQATFNECEPDVRLGLASSRSREVLHCWTIARLPANRRLVLVEFARRDKDALASVALIDGNRIIFADYPAVFKGEGEDLWRVEDGGVLSATDFQVVFLLQRGSFYTLGISWLGAEGRSLAVFVSQGNNRFTRVLAGYWYRMPV